MHRALLEDPLKRNLCSCVCVLVSVVGCVYASLCVCMGGRARYHNHTQKKQKWNKQQLKIKYHEISNCLGIPVSAICWPWKLWCKCQIIDYVSDRLQWHTFTPLGTEEAIFVFCSTVLSTPRHAWRHCTHSPVETFQTFWRHVLPGAAAPTVINSRQTARVTVMLITYLPPFSP